MKDTKTIARTEEVERVEERTVVDYETVEEEVDVYICDSCEQEWLADGDVDVVELGVSPRTERRRFGSARELAQVLDAQVTDFHRQHPEFASVVTQAITEKIGEMKQGSLTTTNMSQLGDFMCPDLAFDPGEIGRTQNLFTPGVDSGTSNSFPGDDVFPMAIEGRTKRADRALQEELLAFDDPEGRRITRIHFGSALDGMAIYYDRDEMKLKGYSYQLEVEPSFHERKHLCEYCYRSIFGDRL